LNFLTFTGGLVESVVAVVLVLDSLFDMVEDLLESWPSTPFIVTASFVSVVDAVSSGFRRVVALLESVEVSVLDSIAVAGPFVLTALEILGMAGGLEESFEVVPFDATPSFVSFGFGFIGGLLESLAFVVDPRLVPSSMRHSLHGT